MEQFSELEGRIRSALDRISIIIEHSKSVQANNNGMDQDLWFGIYLSISYVGILIILSVSILHIRK